MRIPHAFSCSPRLSLEFASLQVCLRRVPLDFLELGPAILQKLGCEVYPVDVGRSDVARDIVAGRQGVRGREGDWFPHGEGTEELA